MKIDSYNISIGKTAMAAKEQKKGHGSIDGSVLKLKPDPIAAKKEEAKKKAMQIVGDAFANEREIDADIESRRERVRSLQQAKGEANTAIKELENKRATLRETYGVKEDSSEEADLKLLEKEVRANRPGSTITLSEEEQEALQKIHEEGLTEYQKGSLNIFSFEAPYEKEIQEADDEIQLENRIISATELERLKSHAMIDARKQADKVMEAASDEIVSMVVDEAKDHIDEEAKEQEEKAEAKKEEQEEIQARIDAAKQRREESEELTKDLVEGMREAVTNASDIDAAKQEVKDMMNKMKLIEDDIKGAAVDQSI